MKIFLYGREKSRQENQPTKKKNIANLKNDTQHYKSEGFLQCEYNITSFSKGKFYFGAAQWRGVIASLCMTFKNCTTITFSSM